MHLLFFIIQLWHISDNIGFYDTQTMMLLLFNFFIFRYHCYLQVSIIPIEAKVLAPLGAKVLYSGITAGEEKSSTQTSV